MSETANSSLITHHTSLKEAYAYCRQTTRTHAKSFYFCSQFLKAEKRNAIYAVYALCRHVDDEVDEAEIRSAEEAAKAVARWREELDAVYKGGNPSSPVLIAWQDMLKSYRIKQELPLELMRCVLMDTHINRYETFDELYVYCYRVASVVGLMSSEIFGYTEPKTLDYAEALGIAMQLTNILRDVGEDARMGRIYLPQEDLRRFNYTEEMLMRGEVNESFTALMKFEIERARSYYKEAEKGIPLLERDARFTVLLASRIYGGILSEIEKQNYDVFTKRAHTTLFQKLRSVPRLWLESRKRLEIRD